MPYRPFSQWPVDSGVAIMKRELIPKNYTDLLPNLISILKYVIKNTNSTK